MPVFSVCGTGAPFPGAAPGDGELDPFGDRSAFAALAEADGVIVWYGAPLSSTTMIHHAERSAGGPLYRYDKHFDGVTWAAGRQHRTSLRYHVRPWGRHLDYDWPRLAADLATHGILQPLRPEPVSHFRPRSADPLGGGSECRPARLARHRGPGWVELLLDWLGRRFEHRDFEPEAPSEMAS
ncbi:MAG: AAC(3) family N-acetyltransferase [Acidimicrobiales bacterium]